MSTASVFWERMFKCYLLRHNEYQNPVVTWGSIKHSRPIVPHLQVFCAHAVLVLLLWKVEVPQLLRIRSWSMFVCLVIFKALISLFTVVAFLRLNANRVETAGSVCIPGKREEVRILTAWKMWARVVRKDQRLLKCTCVRDYAASRLARVFTRQLDLGGMRRRTSINTFSSLPKAQRSLALERMSHEIQTLGYPCRRQLLFL